jgi:Methyltransferase domain
MVCPYCLGRFSVTHSLEERTGRINWALLRCRCFEFPVVDGVLLLSLAKGYGGSEEVLAPYVPLQVAAVEYLRADDLAGLRRWIQRHVPLLHKLIGPRPFDYLSFSKELNARLWPQVEKDLFAWNDYEVLGRRRALKRERVLVNTLATTRIGYGVMKARRRLFPPVWTTFYLTRFVSNEVANLRARLRNVRIDGPLLSLCCGHGPFELLLSGRTPKVSVVSMDGQLLNLFVVKRFIAPDSTYICHDVQFALPFEDRVFSEVFSSTCLSEIPSQAHFIRESRRVTSERGWTMFDAVTPDEDGRIVPTRFYRACQNHFASLDDYQKLMVECAGGRSVHFTSVNPPEPHWTDDAAALKSAPSATFVFNAGAASDFQVAGQDGFSTEERALLAINPRYQIQVKDSKLLGRLRLGERVRAKFKKQMLGALPNDVSIDRRRLDDPAHLAELYRSGVIVLLPKNFASDVVNLFAP